MADKSAKWTGSPWRVFGLGSTFMAICPMGCGGSAEVTKQISGTTWNRETFF